MRVFADVWAELERRHAWRISERRLVNRPSAIAKVAYAWQDIDNRRAAAFRARHHLDAVVAGARDDWEALLRLRHWAFTNVRNGSPPSYGPEDLTTIADASQAGAAFWCTHFAYTFVAAAAAMGWQARHLGIDCDHDEHGRSTHHGVADVWVSRWRKWVVFDVNYDAHYELDGVPLDAAELGRRWRTHRGAGVRAFIGPQRREVAVANGEYTPGQPEACGYFWHYIDLDNDVFHRRFHANAVLLPIDDAKRGRTWYQGAPPATRPHWYYASGQFTVTERLADAYPDLHCVELQPLPPGKMPYYCPVRLWTSAAPNFSHHAIRIDGGEPLRFDGSEYPWRIATGANAIDVRVVDTCGREGPPAVIEIDVVEDAQRTAAWP